MQTILDKDVIVLDFFAGSGTTGHAVMELNKEDDGNRQFILVNDNEDNIAINDCYERLYRIMNGKTTKNKTDFKWLEKNKPYNDNLTVFNLKKYDLSIKNNENILDKINLKTYKLININCNINDENKFTRLYPLLTHLNKIKD